MKRLLLNVLIGILYQALALSNVLSLAGNYCPSWHGYEMPTDPELFQGTCWKYFKSEKTESLSHTMTLCKQHDEMGSIVSPIKGSRWNESYDVIRRAYHEIKDSTTNRFILGVFLENGRWSTSESGYICRDLAYMRPSLCIFRTQAWRIDLTRFRGFDKFVVVVEPKSPWTPSIGDVILDSEEQTAYNTICSVKQCSRNDPRPFCSTITTTTSTTTTTGTTTTPGSTTQKIPQTPADLSVLSTVGNAVITSAYTPISTEESTTRTVRNTVPVHNSVQTISTPLTTHTITTSHETKAREHWPTTRSTLQFKSTFSKRVSTGIQDRAQTTVSNTQNSSENRNTGEEITPNRALVTVITDTPTTKRPISQAPTISPRFTTKATQLISAISSFEKQTTSVISSNAVHKMTAIHLTADSSRSPSTRATSTSNRHDSNENLSTITTSIWTETQDVKNTPQDTTSTYYTTEIERTGEKGFSEINDQNSNSELTSKTPIISSSNGEFTADSATGINTSYSSTAQTPITEKQAYVLSQPISLGLLITIIISGVLLLITVTVCAGIGLAERQKKHRVTQRKDSYPANGGDQARYSIELPVPSRPDSGAVSKSTLDSSVDVEFNYIPPKFYTPSEVYLLGARTNTI